LEICNKNESEGMIKKKEVVHRVQFERTVPAMSRLLNQFDNEDNESNGGARESESPPAHYFSNISGIGRRFNADQANLNEIIDWKQFHNFLLQRMTYKTAEDRLRYAKQYGKVLETGNASDLLNLQPDKRIHAMKALSNLAKFTGKFDVWLQLRQRYNLKWSTGIEKLVAFERFFDDSKTLDTMLQWLRQAIQELPKSYSDFFILCTLTGLPNFISY
jgi:hypothetical protein